MARLEGEEDLVAGIHRLDVRSIDGVVRLDVNAHVGDDWLPPDGARKTRAWPDSKSSRTRA